MSVFLAALLAAAAADTASFLPYGAAEGDTLLVVDDETFSDEMTFNRDVYFYGDKIDTVLVASNGYFLFDAIQIEIYNQANWPRSDPLTKWIAPFHGDFDNRAVGDIWFRMTTANADLEAVNLRVREFFPNYSGFNCSQALIATWDQVGRFNTDATFENSLQAVVAINGNETFTWFDYGVIEWIKAANPGSARESLAGFNRANGVDSFELPLSRSPNMADLVTTSNVDEPSVWAFEVSQAIIPGTSCNSAYGSCSDCITDPGCSWCQSSGQCFATTNAANDCSDGTWDLTDDCCPAELTDLGTSCCAPSYCRVRSSGGDVIGVEIRDPSTLVLSD